MLTALNLHRPRWDFGLWRMLGYRIRVPRITDEAFDECLDLPEFAQMQFELRFSWGDAFRLLLSRKVRVRVDAFMSHRQDKLCAFSAFEVIEPGGDFNY